MPESPLRGIARALREDDRVRDELRPGAGQHLPHEELRSAAVVVLFGHGRVRPHDSAAQRALRRELQEDLRRHDLRHDARKLVGGAAAEDEVVPLGFRRKVSQLALQEVALQARGIEEPVVGVDAAGLLLPRRPQGVHGVGVPVEVDDAFVLRGDAVGRVLERPDEVAVAVVADVLGAADGADLDDHALQVLEARLLVVRKAAGRVAAGILRPVDVVGRDADDLLENLLRDRPVTGRELRHPGVEVAHRLSLPSLKAPPASAPRSRQFRRRERRHHDVHLPVRFPRHVLRVRGHDTGRDLRADVGGQAVHVEGGAPSRRLHPALVADPVAVPRVRGQGLLLDFPHALAVARAVRLDAGEHEVVRPPALRVHRVGVLERFVHRADRAERAAGGGGVRGRGREARLHEAVALRVRERHAGSEARQQHDEPLRHREGLGVARRVGPRHGDALALETLGELLAQPAEVGQRLGGMVDVALEVDDGNLPPVACRREVGIDPLLHVAHERVSLAEDQVVPHAERVRVHAEHGAGLGRGLAVRDLGGRAVHDDRVHAQPGCGARPGRFRTRGIVEEERVGELVR